jgi:DNA replication and repair protein RecF
VRIDELWLTDFRSYRELHLEPAPGLTVLTGANGAGKTNVLEAVGFLASLRSFRGAPADALVRSGAEAAVIRGRTERDGREILIEAELRSGERRRVQVNRQRLGRTRDLLGYFQVAVFSPDDLALVKGGPAGRRLYIDDLLCGLHPRFEQLTAEVERVVRQRNALLKQARGRLTDDVRTTLDVWNAALTTSGEELTQARVELLETLTPHVERSYRELSGVATSVELEYESSWRHEGLGPALERVSAEELRRGVTLVGPHRDDIALRLDGLASRSHASQGEQRSLVLALRLAAHRLSSERIGTPPVLLLDDIFSELDRDRARALIEHLPEAQTLLTTAGVIPDGTEPELVLGVRQGEIRSAR